METKNTGYMPDLDVLRAVAAITVFFWHYLHSEGMPPQEAYWPALAFLEEGHVGVSLFMVLSGYLFFKITWGKTVQWGIFALNRVKRIAPLLLITQSAWLVAGWAGMIPYSLSDFAKGIILPTWTSGAWSIATEIHFYLLLPVLLWIARRSPAYLAAAIAAMIVLRLSVPALHDPSLSYYTLVGRIDQFLIGALCFLYWRHIPALAGAVVFGALLLYLEVFNAGGGYVAFFAGTHAHLPDTFPRWTVEGVGFAGLLVWIFKSNWTIKESFIWQALAWVGSISYSVYLLHFFVLRVWFRAMEWFDLDMTARLALLLPCLGATLLVSWISYEQIEKRFLLTRARYVGAK